MTLTLTFKFLSYWSVGGGGGLAGSYDSRCARDSDGLPYIPGRQVRGLLRDAVRCATDFGWIEDAKAADILFGSRGDYHLNPTRSDTQPGTLRVGSASLPLADKDALRGRSNLIDALFEARRSTAIDPNTGTAKKHSLRVDEICVPLTVIATVTPLGPLGELSAQWRDWIGVAAPLIRAVGRKRSRGLGRCILHVARGL